MPQLLAASGSPVLLCEGEKTADAAAALLGPPWSTAATMNGAQSPHNTDWTPLAGRHVVIWPDNDEPGRAYARAAAALALKAGAVHVRIVDVPDVFPEGWDLADAIPENLDIDPAYLIATAPQFDPDAEEQGTFRVQWRRSGKLLPGLYYKCTERDPDSSEDRPGWHWFASRLDVLAFSRDGENREWGRYLAIYDSDNKVHHIAMAMAAMAGDGAEYRRELLRHGFILAPGKTAREQLEIYLAMWGRRPNRAELHGKRAAFSRHW